MTTLRFVSSSGTIHRKIELFSKVASNDSYDFYIFKQGSSDWWCFAIVKDSDIESTKASFTTKKSAKECANAWATWMNG